jgi:hypothetical protein
VTPFLKVTEYKDISSAVPRSNQEFIKLLAMEVEVALRKKNKS